MMSNKSPTRSGDPRLPLTKYLAVPDVARVGAKGTKPGPQL